MKYDINQLRELWNTPPKNGGIRNRLFDDVFSSHSHYPHRTVIKKFLIDNNVIENKCIICGLSEWQGNPITLQLDHIDGDRHNNQLHNLRLLCPNCHTQTETFSTRNMKLMNKKCKSDDDFVNAIKISENARQTIINQYNIEKSNAAWNELFNKVLIKHEKRIF